MFARTPRPDRLTFVLVHGAWLTGHCWKKVATHLIRRGHRVYTPTLAGHGPGARRDVRHDDCVATVTTLIKRERLDQVVLLGHSFGGTVIARVAEELPDRIARLVFHNAILPLPGGCLLDDLPDWIATQFRRSAATTPDRTIAPDYWFTREHLAGEATDRAVRRIHTRMNPQPIRLFEQRLDLGRFYTNTDLPRTYLNCVDDHALPGVGYGWHPRISERLGQCGSGLYRLVQAPGGHLAMYTRPKQLTEHIIRAGRT